MKSPKLIFADAFASFVVEEGSSLLTDVSERNTCGRLAIYLERQLQLDGVRGYYADIEYNRKQGGQIKTILGNDYEIIPITSDLIVHTRGEKAFPDDNFIAVEIKKSARPVRGKNDDRKRLMAMTSIPFRNVWGWEGTHPEHVCGYKLGVFVEVDISNREIRQEFFEDGRLVGKGKIFL